MKVNASDRLSSLSICMFVCFHSIALGNKKTRAIFFFLSVVGLVVSVQILLKIGRDPTQLPELLQDQLICQYILH